MVKWLAILFIIVNVVVFFGRSGTPTIVEPVAPPIAKNLPKMTLQSELVSPADSAAAQPVNEVVEESIAVANIAVEAPVTSAEGGAVSEKVGEKVETVSSMEAEKAVTETVAAATSEKKSDVESGSFQPSGMVTDIQPASKPEIAAVASKQCYRAFGLAEAESKKFKAVLSKQGVVFTELRGNSADAAQRLKGVRVYMGPYSDQAAVSKQLQALKAASIDAYAMTSSVGRVIQLGFFAKAGKAETNAKAHQETLRKKGVVTKLERVMDKAVQSFVLRFEVDTETAKKARQAANVPATQVTTEKCR